MSRPALSASRAVRVLNLLAANAGRSFTLSEFSRELAVNSASMHAVLTELTASGYLERSEPRKEYRLGRSLVALGQVALDQHPVVRRARDEAERLSRSLDVTALVALPVGREFLTVGVYHPAKRTSVTNTVGERVPFRPPIGIVCAGFAPEEVRERWLDGLGPGASEQERANYRNAAAICRGRGYEIGLDTSARQRVVSAMLALGDDPGNAESQAALAGAVADLGREDHQLVDPEPGALHALDHITAAVFDASGRVAAGVTLLGFSELLPADKVRRYVAPLLTSVDRVTLATGGRIPAGVQR